MSKLYSGAEIVFKCLEDQNVEFIFGYPGGAVLPIYDELKNFNSVKHILVRHEQGAGHAAEGYARSSGKPGVLLVTSGPGATNAVTALTDAYMDSVPLVCISGQVPTHLIGTDAFQECDTTGITRPCTKHNWLVKDVKDLEKIIHKAFEVATTGRPGPVLVDIPKDVQFQKTNYTKFKKQKSLNGKVNSQFTQKDIDELIKLMSKASKPIFYTGGGVINSGPKASELLRELVNTTGFPITSTLQGLGSYPGEDSQFLGMLGMHGSYEANNAMHDCDLMINIGARFDDRITGKIDEFSPKSKKVHIDIDPSSINKNVKVDLPIVGDVTEVITSTIKTIKKVKPNFAKSNKQQISKWWQQIQKWRSINSFDFVNSTESIKPQYAVQRLYELTKNKDTYITTEVGQHQMWAAQHYKFDKPNRWMTSGGLGTMGYGLPAAVGVQVAHPNKLVIDIAGEASVLMTMQEMSTAVQYSLPIKIFILNNEYMGMVRQWQELLHDKNYSESYTAALPDFVKLAEAYGCVGIRAETPGELDDKIIEMINTDRPVIFDCRVDKQENCFPMIPSGKPHNQMLLGPKDQKGNKIQVTYKDTREQLTLSVFGYARVVQKYDELSRLTERSYFDVNGNYIEHKKQGFARLIKKYDTFGNLVEEAFIGKNGKLIQPSGKNYARFIEKYNDQNQTIEEAYYSADGKLAINTEWEFARKLTIYDDQNRVIRESFFGDGGEPILYEGVFHHLERQYNQDGKLVALRSLNKFGKVVFVNRDESFLSQW